MLPDVGIQDSGDDPSLDVELNDCSEKRSADKTGLKENRNSARARTLVRNRVMKEAHSACRLEDGCISVPSEQILKFDFQSPSNSESYTLIRPGEQIILQSGSSDTD